MALIKISNLNVTDPNLVASSDSFLTEILATDSSQIFGGGGEGGYGGKGEKKEKKEKKEEENEGGYGYGHGNGHGYPSVPVCPPPYSPHYPSH